MLVFSDASDSVAYGSKLFKSTEDIESNETTRSSEQAIPAGNEGNVTIRMRKTTSTLPNVYYMPE